MGSDSNSTAASPSTATPNGKRSRDPEGEVYIDNLHSHKRYLSEIMASSLNGLTVGDHQHQDHHLPENLTESPARDEMCMQYSPMSEDSDEARFCDHSISACSSPADSRPTSPVSPYRYQRPHVVAAYAPATTSSYPYHGCTSNGIGFSQPRQRSSDSEARFPSSPSDICHSADLRRAALLRSVQMRTQPQGSSSSEMQFISGPDPVPNMDSEERPCPYVKSSIDDGYQTDECDSMSIISEPQFSEEKACRALSMDPKDDAHGD